MINREQVSEEKKETAIKTLAIIGVIAVAFLLLWVLVQAVRLAPSAFVSLANIADGLYGSEVSLDVSSSKSVVNTGEPFFVTWTDMNREGTYYFSYSCVDGVSAEARDANGEIVRLSCETPLALEGDKNSIEVIFESEKRRFIDVAYTVSFAREEEETPDEEKMSLITVVNASITTSSEVANANGDEVDDETDTGSVAGATDSTGGGSGGGAVGGTIRTVPITTTYFPTSNPNGKVDLRVAYLGIGSLDDDNEFTPRGELDNDRRGAIRFEVKNIGTKTSDDWEFEATLPTDPTSTYESPEQDGLRPNERAVITLGFDNLGDPRTEEIEVEISGGDDDNDNNNDFKWSVKIVN